MSSAYNAVYLRRQAVLFHHAVVKHINKKLAVKDLTIIQRYAIDSDWGFYGRIHSLES